MALKLNGTNSVAAPAYAGADADTGLQCGTDEVNLVTGGTARLKIDSSGRVGIGTTSPNSELEIKNASTSAGFTITTGNTTEDGYINFSDGSTAGQILYKHSDNYMRFYVNAAERMRIDSSGNVGINQTPTRELSLHSPNNNNSYIHFTNDDTGETSSDGALVGIDGNEDLQINNQESSKNIILRTGGSERMRIDSSGRVGIAHSSFTDARESLIVGAVSGQTTVFQIIRSSSTSGNAALYFGDTDNNYRGGVIYENASDALVFRSAGTEAMRIDSSGRLLLNSGSDVRIEFGTNGTTGTNDRNFVRGDGDNMKYNTNSGGHHIFESNGTERFIVENDGESRLFSGNTTYTLVLSNGTDAGTAYLFLEGRYSATSNNGVSGTRSFMITTNGNIYNTNNSYNALSDAKLKENIVDASSQWQDIKDIRVRNYNFIEGQTHTQIGVVAQEVETVSPGLVSELPDRDDEGNDLGTVTKSINYSVLYMKAVKALQEAQTRIETLETQHADLLARITALEAA